MALENNPLKKIKKKDVMGVYAEEATRGTEDVKSSKKPGLDYYDNKREQNEDGSDVPYQGRYGIFKKE